MSSLEELRKERFQFLHRLYEKTGGDQHKVIDMWELGRQLGFDKDKTGKIHQYLLGEYLIETASLGGTIRVTHYGVIEVEEALSRPEEPTEFFPPVNIINIHHMQNSQIQQGVINSTQSQSMDLKLASDIQGFIESLEAKLQDLYLDRTDMAEIEADINTVKAQLSSSRLKKGIVAECLGSIKRMLEGAGGSVVAQQLTPLIPPLITGLGM